MVDEGVIDSVLYDQVTLSILNIRTEIFFYSFMLYYSSK